MDTKEEKKEPITTPARIKDRVCICPLICPSDKVTNTVSPAKMKADTGMEKNMAGNTIAIEAPKAAPLETPKM